MAFCKKECEESGFGLQAFSNGFLLRLAQSIDSVRIETENDMIYSTEQWTIRYGSIAAAIELILKQSTKAMHFSEVFDRLKKLRQIQVLSQGVVHNALSSSVRVFLWDRGTFIYRESAPFPYALIRDIERWLELRLREDIPFVSVHGVFNYYENRCLDAGIPSETALYSLLRSSADPVFVYPRYPHIYLSKGYEERLPVPLAFEQFIRDTGGPLSLDELREFALDGLGLRPYQLDQAISRLPNVVRTRGWGFLHTDFLNIEWRKFAEIIKYTQSLVSDVRHISVRKIFSDKAISCKVMGIESPEMLFSAFQLFANNELGFGSYPQVLAKSDANKDFENRGIRVEVANYVRDKANICTYDELEECFVEKLGYKEQTVFSVAESNGVYRYLSSCVIHGETIRWTGQKQQSLEQLASDLFGTVVKAGQCYGLILDLLESNSLPELANGILWTHQLLEAFLTREGRFKVLGNQKNAFVPVPNALNIQNFEDLIYILLKQEHNGAANLKSFEENLRLLGIIKKGLTQSMIGNTQKVSIIGKEILLNELIANV